MKRLWRCVYSFRSNKHVCRISIVWNYCWTNRRVMTVDSLARWFYVHISLASSAKHSKHIAPPTLSTFATLTSQPAAGYCHFWGKNKRARTIRYYCICWPSYVDFGAFIGSTFSDNKSQIYSVSFLTIVVLVSRNKHSHRTILFFLCFMCIY